MLRRYIVLADYFVMSIAKAPLGFASGAFLVAADTTQIHHGPRHAHSRRLQYLEAAIANTIPPTLVHPLV